MCDEDGSLSFQCDRETGVCPCRENILDTKCTQCAIEHYNFPDCEPCHCDLDGAIDNYCNVITGNCVCNSDKIVGKNCDECAINTFGYPNCQGKIIFFLQKKNQHKIEKNIHTPKTRFREYSI